jgi:DNA (cytosine-5)-methyltransferase 1
MSSKPTDKWPFPEPDEKVCGASTDRKVYWNYINAQLGSRTNFGPPSGGPAGPGGDHRQAVLQRYLGGTSSPAATDSPSAQEDWLQPADHLLKKICAQDQPLCRVCPLKYNCSWYASEKSPAPGPSFADFFCGAGGLSLGFEWAGLSPKIATDIDRWFMATYAYNRSNHAVELSAGDIREWLMKNKKRKDWEIDIVTGGVPCQSFSTANRQRKENDPRDKLYTSLLEACRLIGPKVILIENVSGMLKEYEGVISDLGSLGYHAAHLLLNAKDYGIPQNRRRIFFIAFSSRHFTDAEARLRSAIAAIQDKKTDNPVPLQDAIGDLPPLQAHDRRNDTAFNNESSGRAFGMHAMAAASPWVRSLHDDVPVIPLFHHKARYNNERDIEIFRRLRPGENSLAGSIREIMPYSSRNGIFSDKYFKLRYDQHCRTITAHMRYDCNMYIHPEQARGLTAREAARVQSFPDDYVFLGNFQRLYQQIGNAVPPLLAKVLGEAIRENINYRR